MDTHSIVRKTITAPPARSIIAHQIHPNNLPITIIESKTFSPVPTVLQKANSAKCFSLHFSKSSLMALTGAIVV